ncbi:hypothetical protein COX85_03035 [Candidatus Micrarchaeota archaeon CG_4_10_14_0_2_um_filter_55_9]|nr:MAG: hypothetical protein AUJ15_01150 [Candidatus Micrarchaeota archaeon CG1_02_55_41]PIO03850.1 MAG: hypothetical protein COT57_00225 [Candidatus Micrarchaeota archaeon CG09_land_8_20_14_0_10_55_25]PIZ91603.1 MAG: hypothetical protein COX85_03035 [Candidatus Micrarchaeota archaeon CG_4_10_14_0_2_um_filter_55_9]PJD00998.1 MAG: hypothetical protein COU38_03425 [Candidatus Micrarchaeota archaeon CG10_big_fil_rev_8_21_14_0_10_54_18]
MRLGGIYVLTPALPKNELKEFVSGCAGADLMQLRFKKPDGSPSLTVNEMIEVTEHAKKVLPCPVIVNDCLELASRADGAHVGQGDSAWTTAKKTLGEKIVGLSAREPEQFKRLMEDAKRFGAMPDYVSTGSIFPTQSKFDAEVTGLERLDYARRVLERAGTPLFAVGGINKFNATQLTGKCDGIAVIGAINRNDPEQSIRELRAAFKGGNE